jgi:Domain of unknown function (DUF4456)
MQAMQAYRTMSAFPKAIYNGLLQQEKVTITKNVESTLHELAQRLVLTAADRKAHETALSPALAHPAQQGTLSALMEREEKRAAEAICTISDAACSCRKSAVHEALNAQRMLHNAAHIMGQLLNSWVMPQDLTADVTTEYNEVTTSVEVLLSTTAGRHWHQDKK